MGQETARMELLAAMQGELEVVSPRPVEHGAPSAWLTHDLPASVSRTVFWYEPNGRLVGVVRVGATATDPVGWVLLVPSGVPAYAVSETEAVEMSEGIGSRTHLVIHQGTVHRRLRLFGQPEAVREHADMCASGSCPVPSMHCAAFAVLDSIADGHWSRLDRWSAEVVAAAISRALAGIAMGARVPSRAADWAVAFGPSVLRAAHAARKLAKGPHSQCATEWLARIRRFREATSQAVALHVAQADQFKDAATGRTLFSAVVRPSLDRETVRAIVFAEENGAPAWARAMARPNILSQLPILDWPERAAERNPQLFASALKGLLSRLRDQPDRVWSPETKNISRHLRWMSKHGPATRRAVAAFVRELRSLRAELTDIVVHAPGDTVVQRIYNIGRIMAERGLGGDEPYRVAERVLNACPASETMRELSQALA